MASLVTEGDGGGGRSDGSGGRARGEEETTKTSVSKGVGEGYDELLSAARKMDFGEFERNLVLTVNEVGGVPVVVFTPRAAGAKPDMDLLLSYMIGTLDKIVQSPYVLVYCHTGTSWLSRKHFAWLKQAYGLLGRTYKKNISKLLIVHPSFVLSAGFAFARPFLSKKFWRKVHRCGKVEQARRILGLGEHDDVTIPPLVFESEGSAVPVRRLFFGALIEKQPKGGNGCPVVVEETCRLLLETGGLGVEGMFRVPGSVKGIEAFRDHVEAGNAVEGFKKDEFPDQAARLNVLGGVLKLYLRELPVPLVPYECYQPLVELSKGGSGALLPVEVGKRAFEIIRSGMGGDGFKCLLFVLGFLFKFEQASEATKMTAKNLAIVFAPNVLRAPSSTGPLVEAQQMKDCIAVLEHLIKFFDRFPTVYDFDYSRVVEDHGIGVGPLLNGVKLENGAGDPGHTGGGEGGAGKRGSVVEEVML
jgi:Rho GTPase-activating protein 1|eukprot:g4078.t1